LPSLAKELASETDSRDDKVSTQVRFIREERKAAFKDREPRKLLAPYHSQSRIFWSFLLGRELGVRGGVAF
jgi:hypothetical protein